jgi:propanol-preferring alcohol dehydrogenase
MGSAATQKAAITEEPGPNTKTVIKDIPIPTPADDEILVKLNWSGLCHSDVHLMRNDWADRGLKMQVKIAGHEGAGTVVAAGKNVHRFKLGDRAGIKWVANTCGDCEMCMNGTDELHCPKQLNSGFTVDGTFQQYATTSARYATKIPAGVLDEEAGPVSTLGYCEVFSLFLFFSFLSSFLSLRWLMYLQIMCGGVTAYTALKRSAVAPGQWVVLPGAGGGLGHFAVQYAKAMGMRIIAIDGGAEKKALCERLGAEHFIDFTTEKDITAKVKEITGWGAHGVVVTAASRAGYEQAPYLLRAGGTVVCVGLPKEDFVAGAPPIVIALNRLNIIGSVTGTLQDVDEALDFTSRGLVKPILVKGCMKDIDSLSDQMLAGKLPGRAVIDLRA